MIVYLHIPKCGGTSVLNKVYNHYNGNTSNYLEVYTKHIKPSLVTDIVTSGSFERIKAFMDATKPYYSGLGLENNAPGIILGHGVYNGIDSYYPDATAEYHTVVFNPIDRAISLYRFRRAGYLQDRTLPRIYKEGGVLDNNLSSLTAEFEKEDGTERTFSEWFDYFNTRNVDEYDSTSYKRTFEVRNLTTGSFSWIGNESHLTGIGTLNTSSAYDVPERSEIAALVNTYWPDDMAIYSSSFAYEGTTPFYLQ